MFRLDSLTKTSGSYLTPPRCVKRRPKQYTQLKRPRSEFHKHLKILGGLWLTFMPFYNVAIFGLSKLEIDFTDSTQRNTNRGHCFFAIYVEFIPYCSFTTGL